MDEKVFINKAKEYIASVSSAAVVDMFVVWQSKILQNNKALISWRGDSAVWEGVRVVDYVEVTYNGDKGAFSFDWYSKEADEVVKL